MAILNRLSAVFVRTAPLGRHADGGGLYLRVRPNGSKAWVFRGTVNGREREVGLGPWPDTSLAAARDDAIQCRRWLQVGLDPRIERKREDQTIPTFDEAVERYVKLHAPGWADRHRLNWENSLKLHASAVLGDMPVNEIRVEHVLELLTPMWDEKTETASRVRQRIEKVLDACAVRGERPSENPARWRGRLGAILPKKSDLVTVEHFKAMAWGDVPEFMLKLREKTGMGARALELTILTAARSGETRGAVWSEIDLKAKTWTIPADRMKTGEVHRVPLSPQALNILRALPRIDDSPLVFPSVLTGRQLSDMTLTKALRDLGADVTTHGFRSSFRDWCSDETRTQRETAEAALSHKVKNQTEAAYARSDLFKKRRSVMDRWGRWCASTPVKKVVGIGL